MMMEREKDEIPGLPKMHIPPVIFVIVGFCCHTLMADCPSLCECKWKNGKETVICLNANLSVVPPYLDSGTQVLDLTGNTIATLKNEEFSKAGLLNLQRIFVSKCKLKSLQRYVFKNLKNLVELDLSLNLLSAIPSHTFDPIFELRELKLNGNPIQTILNEAFVNVPQLVRLELNDCKISDVEPRAFVGLERSLEWLKLDGNRLSEIHSSSLTRLENLHGLELAGNPWNCSCALRPLRNWMLRRNVPFGIPPLCQNPKRLKGKSWEKLDLDEFACIPEISSSDTVTYGVEGKNVTITCHIGGIPEPNVRWMVKNKLIANFSGPPYSNNKKLYVVQLGNNSSDLTIFSADLQDAGVYVCSAENKAGKVEASVTLAVSRKPQEQTISVKILLVSVLIGVLLVVISCSISLCICSRKKSAVKWRQRECARDDNYEKIELNNKVNEKCNTNGGVVQRSEISTVNKRNGDYSVVPTGDIDQDLDEEETSTLDIASKFPHRTKEFDDDQKWKSLDEPDTREVQGMREDSHKITTSTSGTFKKIEDSSTPTNFANITRESPDGHGVYVNNSYKPRTTDAPFEFRRKKFPDIVGNNSASYFNFKTVVGARGSNSEGGSVNDISELFCTLPRNSKRYRSTDSEVPLLADSRYVSSGGESYSSQESAPLKRVGDSYKYTVNNLNENRVNQISNSYLNLYCVDKPTTSQEFRATPLLDISGLENRATKPGIFSPTSGTPNANSYDYHATQLERFLEEYRNLQKQLTKMKETCDNLRQDTNYLKAVSRTNSNDDVKKTMELGNFQSDLAKYLLTKSASPKPYATSNMFNN